MIYITKHFVLAPTFNAYACGGDALGPLVHLAPLTQSQTPHKTNNIKCLPTDVWSGLKKTKVTFGVAFNKEGAQIRPEYGPFLLKGKDAPFNIA